VFLKKKKQKQLGDVFSRLFLQMFCSGFQEPNLLTCSGDTHKQTRPVLTFHKVITARNALTFCKRSSSLVVGEQISLLWVKN